MRLPPDVIALLIKTRDFALVFAPALLAAITLKSVLLTVFSLQPFNPAKIKWPDLKWSILMQSYLTLSSPPNSGPGLFSLFSFKNRQVLASQAPSLKPTNAVSHKLNWLKMGALTASPATLVTAMVLSPVLLLVRLGVGAGLGLVGWWLSKTSNTTVATQATDTLKEETSQPIRANSKSDEVDAGVKEPGPDSPGLLEWPERLRNAWLGEGSLYLDRTLYNFFLAALLTIFVPVRLIENWFGVGQIAGPLLIPAFGLLLARAAGSEMALVLALFIKGAGTGSGVAAMLAFPLLTLPGLVERHQKDGLKFTLKSGLTIWALAAGTGLLLEVAGLNAGV